MNVNSLITMDYENISDWTLGENKPNSNPIKPNLKRAKMDVNIYYKEVYENILCIPSSRKANPNKPNFKRRTYSLTGQSGFITMVSDKIIDNFAEVTGAWWCPWSSKPVWG